MMPGATFAQLTEMKARLFIAATMAEMAGKTDDEPAIESQFLIQILNKRIEVLNLPIKFTMPAKMAVLAYTDRPGAVIMLLIDCLTACEGKTVTVADLVNLYPDGFYDEKSSIRYIDEYLKPKKVKWAEVY